MDGSRKYRIFILLYIAWCVSYLDRAVMSIAAPAMLKDIAISPSEQGLILGVFFLSYAVMQIPGGWLADRYGSRMVVITGLIAWSIFTFCTGLSQSIVILVAVRLLFGMGEGIFPPASIKAIHENFPREARGKASSALVSSNYVAYMIAPSLMLPLLSIVGWRGSFYAMSAVGILCAGVYAILTRHQDRDLRPSVAPNNQALLSVVRHPAVWRLTAIWFLISLINKGLDSWMPTYLLNERHLALGSAGLMMTLPYVAAALATLAGGWLMVRFFEGREHHFMTGNAVIACVGLFAMARASSVESVVAAEVLVYFFKSLVFAAVVALPAKIMSPDIVASGFGVINFGGQIAGFFAPIAIGAALDATGSYPTVFAGLLGAGVLAVIISLLSGAFGAAIKDEVQ